MKTIIVSVNPRYAEQILNGKKTIEVRKFRLEPPFKVVNYVTKCGNDKLKNQLLRLEDTGECVLCSTTDLSKYKLNGKVAFEYVVNRADMYLICKDLYNEMYFATIGELEQACLTQKEIREYGKGKPLYGWYISDLIIYNKPKELREFRKPCNHKIVYGEEVSGCGACRMWRMNYKTFTYECILGGKVKITRPPQNFVYCEDLSEVEK